jgi:hypothetical protein
MTTARDDHDDVPVAALAPVADGRPVAAEEPYSATEEEEIAARLEALGYLD